METTNENSDDETPVDAFVEPMEPNGDFENVISSGDGDDLANEDKKPEEDLKCILHIDIEPPKTDENEETMLTARSSNSVSTTPTTPEISSTPRRFEISVETLPKTVKKFVGEVEVNSSEELSFECCRVFDLNYEDDGIEIMLYSESLDEPRNFPDRFDFSTLPDTLRFLVVDRNKCSEQTKIPIPYRQDETVTTKKTVKEEEEEDGRDLLYVEEEDVDVQDVILDEFDINVRMENPNAIEDELEDDYLAHVRQLPRQPTNTPTDKYEEGKFEEEEEEGEEEEGRSTKKPNLKAPKEIIEGLKISMTKPSDPLIHRKTKICVCGKVSSGKSSLLNYIMSGEMNYVCPSGASTTTRSISHHQYFDDEKEEHHDLELIQKRLHASNVHNEGEDLVVKSFQDEKWKNVTFVDMPGLDDYYYGVTFRHDEERGRDARRRIFSMREKIEKVIQTSDIVLYLVDPRNLDNSDVHGFLKRVSELNNNVIITVTKFDLMVKQICDEHRRDFSLEEREDLLEEEIIRIFNLLQEKFLGFGCPVVCVQVKEKPSMLGPHYFSSQYLVHVIRALQNPKKESLLALRNEMYNFMSMRRQIPVHRFKCYKDKVRSRRHKILALGGAGGSFTASAIVGGVGLVGMGLGIGLLAIPGVGTSLGGAAISSGAAAITGSVVGGLALIGGTIAFGSIAGILGGLVAFGISSSIGSWSLNIPPSGRVAMSFFHEDIGNVIGRVEIEKKNVWKKVVKYEKSSVIPNSRKESAVRKKYFEDEEVDYYDSCVVKYSGKYFVIVGRFKNDRIITIVNIYEVARKVKGEKKKKK